MQTAKQILETIKLRCELDLCGLSENELIEAIDDVIQANQDQRTLELREKIKTLECKDMSDVCELAHNRTEQECLKNNIPFEIVPEDDAKDVEYTDEAQKIFDKHYDHIITVTEL